MSKKKRDLKSQAKQAHRANSSGDQPHYNKRKSESKSSSKKSKNRRRHSQPYKRSATSSGQKEVESDSLSFASGGKETPAEKTEEKVEEGN